MITITLTRELPADRYHFWMQKGNRKESIGICNDGLSRLISIPRQAKKLHITLSFEKPKSLSNVLIFEMDRYNDILYYNGKYRTMFLDTRKWIIRKLGWGYDIRRV